MDIFKIFALIIFSSFLLVILRQYKPEYSFAIGVVISAGVFAAMLPLLKSILDFIVVISSKSSVALPVLPILKAVGIAIIVSLAADICKDSGESAMAEKIIFAGKITIITLALPLAKELITLM